MGFFKKLVLSGNTSCAYQQPYSVNLLPKLIAICQRETRLAQSNAQLRTAQYEQFFGNIDGSFEDKINDLHARYERRPDLIDRLIQFVFEIMQDDKKMNSRANQAITAVGGTAPKGIEELAYDSWIYVSSVILSLLRSIQTGNTQAIKSEEKRDVENILAKFVEYDSAVLPVDEFIDKYFFGSRWSLFANILLRRKGKGLDLIKKQKQEPGAKDEYTSRTMTPTLYDEGDQKKTQNNIFDVKKIEPLQSSGTGFDFNDLRNFIALWNRFDKSQQVEMIYEAIKDSDSPYFGDIQITRELVEHAFSQVTQGIQRASHALRSWALAGPEAKPKYEKHLERILTNDFILQETINSVTGEGAQSAETDSEDTSLEELYGHNRKMMHDMATKKYPNYRPSIGFLDPFNLLGALKSPKLVHAINDPVSIFMDQEAKLVLANYILGVAMLQADSQYNYYQTRGGKKSNEQKFDAVVMRFVEQEIKEGFGSVLNEKQIANLYQTTEKLFYDEATDDQIRRYRMFLNIAHRELGTTHAMYEAGYQWGTLTDEQMHHIASVVMKQVYPRIKEFGSRRGFKVLKDLKSTVLIPDLDEQTVHNLLIREIKAKNAKIQEMMQKSGQQGPDVDIGKVVNDFKMRMDAVLVNALNYNAAPEKTASKKYFRGIVSNSNINFETLGVNGVYLKWLAQQSCR